MTITDSVQTKQTATPIARPSARPNLPADQSRRDTQTLIVGGDTNIRASQNTRGSQHPLAGSEQSPHPATADSTSKGSAPGGVSISDDGHGFRDPQASSAVVASTPPAPANPEATPILLAPVLADPLLALAADVLDDLERVRIANENRLRQLTRTETDSDGEDRGFGLDLAHPSVVRVAALVLAMKCDSPVASTEKTPKRLGCCLEHDAERNLTARLKQHPLGPWVKQARGVGEKQAARLLAAIGDPYWNDLHDRPRLVSELWSYAGYGDATKQVRRRGEKSNWSADAKMRAYLVAVSIVKAGGPYREVYDAARAKYADAVHQAECRRCGPAGKPALPGSPISAGHQHARSLRMVSKEILRDLWHEAKRLHELHDGGQLACDAHTRTAVVVDPTSSGQSHHGTQPQLAAGPSSASSDVPPS